METGLTLKVFKMDWSFLIKNYLNPEMWQKEWTLFEYKQFKVTMNIWSIQTRNEQIMLDIKTHYVTDEGYKSYKEQTVSFSLKIEDITFLKRQVNSAIFNTMVEVEKEVEIKKTERFKDLLDMRREENNRLTEIASKFLADAGVSNENCAEAYIDAYVDEYSKVPDMIDNYISGQIYLHLPDLYLTWLSCLEDDPKRDIRTNEIKEKLTDVRYKEIEKEIDEYKKYMQTEEFEDEATSNLEEV